jgi:PhnB protein
MPNDAERSLPGKMIDQLEIAVEAMLRGERATPRDEATAALMGIASDLRDLPREGFLARLAQELEEEGEHMTTATETKTVREGYRTVTPYIVVKQIERIAEFLKQGLGAEETFRSGATGSGGGFHFEFRLGNSMLMAGGAPNYPGAEITPSLHYFVDDVDEAYRRALDAGAKSLYAPKEQPYGVRDCGVRDTTGVEWFLSTPMKYSQGTLAPGDLALYLTLRKSDEYIAFLKQAFGAEEIEIHREQDRVAHAKVRIQDSLIELSDAHGEWQPRPTMLFLYVDDADVWFNRAVAAGAQVHTPMGDQPYGRTGAVRDMQGNLWHMCTPTAPK